jgi:hypothetical protein
MPGLAMVRMYERTYKHQKRILTVVHSASRRSIVDQTTGSAISDGPERQQHCCLVYIVNHVCLQPLQLLQSLTPANQTSDNASHLPVHFCCLAHVVDHVCLQPLQFPLLCTGLTPQVVVLVRLPLALREPAQQKHTKTFSTQAWRCSKQSALVSRHRLSSLYDCHSPSGNLHNREPQKPSA